MGEVCRWRSIIVTKKLTTGSSIPTQIIFGKIDHQKTAINFEKNYLMFSFNELNETFVKNERDLGETGIYKLQNTMRIRSMLTLR